MPDGSPAGPLMGALTGAFAGLSFHVLHLVLEREWLAERPAMALAAFAVVFFTALLGMAGPLPLRRAALSDMVRDGASGGFAVFAEVLAGDPVSIVVRGLAPGARVTLTAERPRIEWNGPQLFRATASFVADATGVVALDRTALDLADADAIARVVDAEQRHHGHASHPFVDIDQRFDGLLEFERQSGGGGRQAHGAAHLDKAGIVIAGEII